MSTLTRAEFHAAELIVRRIIVAKEFDPEERTVLHYFVERSFPIGRVAAFFGSFGHLARLCGRSRNWRSHAHEAFSRLMAKRVLVRYVAQWYGLNIHFLEWDVKDISRPETYDEQDELSLADPSLKRLLAEAFVDAAGEKVLPVTDREPFAIIRTDRGRDAGPAQQTHGKEPEARVSPPAFPDQAQPAKIPWQRLRDAITSNRVEEEFPEAFAARSGVPPEGTPVVNNPKSVPSGGTLLDKKSQGVFPGEHPQVFPDAKCSPAGNTSKPNAGAVLMRPGTAGGTFPYIASSALSTKAELSYNEKVAAAWSWLERIDSTGGLKVDRFRAQWQEACERFPDYILNVLPNVIDRQIELRGQVAKPLALCARAARADGKLR